MSNLSTDMLKIEIIQKTSKVLGIISGYYVAYFAGHCMLMPSQIVYYKLDQVGKMNDELAFKYETYLGQNNS